MSAATASVAPTESCPTDASIEALDREIVSLSRYINRSTYELLVLVREFDERAGWRHWGTTSCADWLHWRCDLSVSAARERVRVAHALKGLHQISAAFEAGDLSYSKVRALTRVANPRNEAELVAFAMTTTAARVEERCRQLRNVHPAAVAEANRAHAGRSLRAWPDRDRGVVVVTVELPAEQAEVVLGAVDRAVEAGRCESGPEFGEVSWSAQRADALVAVAGAYLSGGASAEGSSPSGGSSAERYQVVVHVDASAIEEGTGRADLPLESVKRLLCDGSVVTLTESAQGQALDIGRKRRTIPTALRRALWARDGGCSFPGCTNTHFVDAHHVRHWADGGETSLSNTLLACSFHHRLLHEGGYTVHRDAEGHWYFRRPDGRAVPACGYEAAFNVHAAAQARMPDGIAEAPARYVVGAAHRCGHPPPSAEAPDGVWYRPWPDSQRGRENAAPWHRISD